jgi:hypothetical protein
MNFVPHDVKTDPDDVAYFLEQLTDEEFLAATRRELGQCAVGEKVESVKGDQVNRAVFTLLPLIPLSDHHGGSLDIVREVAFISTDGGVTWTAEV